MAEQHVAEKRAIAIKYDPDNKNAPIITAVGKGRVAEKILESAEQNNVPTYEDEFQAETLSSMDVGSKIPKFLYDLVAEILIFVEDIDERKQSGYI